MTREPGAAFRFSCPGGDCEMPCRCRSGAVRTFGCTGGDRHFDCAPSSTCRTSCLGEDCTRS